MTSKVIISHSENDTRELGRKLAENLSGGLIVLMYGDLGSGKTVFVRGVGEYFGVHGVRSPSFTLINEYETDSGLYIIHADLYRLDPEGVYALGLEEYAGADDCVMFVEWPDRWQNIPDNHVLKVYFSALSESEREIKFCANDEEALSWL